MKSTVGYALLIALLPVTAAFAQDAVEDPVQKAAQSTAQDAGKAPPQMSAEHQAMMKAWEKASTPGPEHAQLAKDFVGEWDVKMTFWMDPDKPPLIETGKSVNTAILGGRQIHMHFDGEFMGQPYAGIGNTGYDNVRGKYTSTWMDNMSTATMLTTGEYDADSHTYTFHGQMADPMNDGAMIPIRETVRVVDADHHVLEMFEPHDGKQVRTMRLEYVRAE